MLIPIGEFDDKLDLRVDGPRRLDDQILRRPVHQIQAELRPALAALGRDV